MKSSAVALAAWMLLGATTARGATDAWLNNRPANVDGNSQQACDALPEVAIPPGDQPTPAEEKALGEHCDSLGLYEGVDKPPDYRAARLCAYAGKNPMPTVDEMVLMMIYANGQGVPRNLPLARQFTCKYSWAPAERDLRMQHLDAIEKGEPGSAPIHMCEDITSGAMMGVCASVDSGKAEVARDAKLDAIAGRFPPAAKAAYAKLRKAATEYLNAAAENEEDPGGSGHVAWVAEAYDNDADAFLADVQAFAAGKYPEATGDADADAKLNAAYRKAMAAAEGAEYPDARPDGIRETERAWLKYRDAWLEFSRAARPGVDTGALLRALTAARTKQLAGLLPAD